MSLPACVIWSSAFHSYNTVNMKGCCIIKGVEQVEDVGVFFSLHFFLKSEPARQGELVVLFFHLSKCARTVVCGEDGFLLLSD